MTEEQRWKMQHQIELDRNKCLKGIWDELKNITGLLKVQAGVSPIIKVANKEDIIGVDLAAKDIGDYRGAKFNGEWHGEYIDPSDPSRK